MEMEDGPGSDVVPQILWLAHPNTVRRIWTFTLDRGITLFTSAQIHTSSLIIRDK